jgi:transposase InsO family protein
MGHRLTVDLAEQALTMTLSNRTPTAGLRHHSDRVSQYAIMSYQRRLGMSGIFLHDLRRTGHGISRGQGYRRRSP